MEGKGLIRWKKTKDVYEGTFKNGLPDGVGLYWWGKGTQRYLGQFKKGRKMVLVSIEMLKMMMKYMRVSLKMVYFPA